MEGNEGDIEHFLRCPSFFASAYTFSVEIVLVYVFRKNPIAPYSLVLYLRWMENLEFLKPKDDENLHQS